MSSSKFNDDKKLIQKWLIYSLLKRAFSGTPDNVLRPLRQVISGNHDLFPLDRIINAFKGRPKSIIFTSADIDNFLLNKYGKSYTFSFLALLYPTLDYRNKFHQDHIFPKSLFSTKNLVKKGYNEYKCEFYLANYDCIANLQLIEAIPNQEKSDIDFKEWLYDSFPDKKDREDYMQKHYIPNIDLSFDNFEIFINERKKLLIKKLKSLLNYEVLTESEKSEDKLMEDQHIDSEPTDSEEKTYRISKKNIKKQGEMKDSQNSSTGNGSKIILKYLKAKGSPATMKDIKGYMQSQGFKSKTYYDWINALIYQNIVSTDKVNGKKAYFLTSTL